MNLFYLDKPKAYESDYLRSMLGGLKDRIHCSKLSRRAKDILLPKWDTETPDDSTLKRLLIAEPKELISLNDALMQKLTKCHANEVRLKRSLLKVFNYEGIFDDSSKKRAFELSKHIGTNTCCYCNRQYTFTVEKQSVRKDKNKGFVVSGAKNRNERIARPAFDHWYPKFEYPLLSLSLYNLIPSCSICNSSAKESSKLSLNSHIHPYVHDEGIPKITFKVEPSIMPDRKWTVVLDRKENSKEDNTIKIFHLDEMYKMHDTLEVKDIMDLKEAYPNEHLTDLVSQVKKDLLLPTLSFNDVYRIIFGSEYDDTKVLNRPLGKMKNDLIQAIQVLSSK